MWWDVIGYSGALLVVVAYFLAAAGVWSASGTRSAAANVLAGVALAVNGLYHGAMPSVLLNTVWAAIGVGALLRAARPRDRAGDRPVGADGDDL
jgi:hypothetical protein